MARSDMVEGPATADGRPLHHSASLSGPPPHRYATGRSYDSASHTSLRRSGPGIIGEL